MKLPKRGLWRPRLAIAAIAAIFECAIQSVPLVETAQEWLRGRRIEARREVANAQRAQRQAPRWTIVKLP
jgi:hypothetical protein